MWIHLQQEKQCCKTHWSQTCRHAVPMWSLWQDYSHKTCTVLSQEKAHRVSTELLEENLVDITFDHTSTVLNIEYNEIENYFYFYIALK